MYILSHTKGASPSFSISFPVFIPGFIPRFHSPVNSPFPSPIPRSRFFIRLSFAPQRETSPIFGACPVISSAAHSGLFLHQRSALWHYHPLRASVNFLISASRSNIPLRSVLQDFVQKIAAPTEFLIKKLTDTVVQNECLKPRFDFLPSASRSSVFLRQRSALQASFAPASFPFQRSALRAPVTFLTSLFFKGRCKIYGVPGPGPDGAGQGLFLRKNMTG